MKTLSVMVLLSIFSAFGIQPSEEKASTDALLIEIPIEAETGQWGTWKTTSCYGGIDFRVEYRGENYSGSHKWGVQFKNRYREKIHFNFEVYDNAPSNPRTTNRTDLDSSEESSGYRDFYMNNGNSIYVYVDKVRFGRDGLQDYYSCDR